MNTVTVIGFGLAFVLDIVIVGYSVCLAKRLGGSGLIANSLKAIALSATAYGIHNFIKAFYGTVGTFGTIADSFELLSGLVLTFAAYQFYKLTKV